MKISKNLSSGAALRMADDHIKPDTQLRLSDRLKLVHFDSDVRKTSYFK